MKLDSKINKIAIIYDCFDSDDARTSIGEEGYFTHFYHCFSDLSQCKFGVLQDVIDDEHPYDNGKNQYDFFLPDRYVIDPIKGLRPFTIDEFTDTFDILETVVFRKRTIPNQEFHVVYLGFILDGNGNHVIIFGVRSFFLNELLEQYEYQDKDGNWKPFGVEE